MTARETTGVAPIALAPDGGEAIWFMGGLALIKSDGETTSGTVAVIEHIGRPGGGSPLHRHTREDEWFYVIEGELTFWVGGQTTCAPAGSFVYGPKGIAHTFQVTSASPARFLLVTEPAGFERFVRALGTPAEAIELPPAPTGPPDPEHVKAVAAEYGIEILGPPGIPLD